MYWDIHTNLDNVRYIYIYIIFSTCTYTAPANPLLLISKYFNHTFPRATNLNNSSGLWQKSVPKETTHSVWKEQSVLLFKQCQGETSEARCLLISKVSIIQHLRVLHELQLQWMKPQIGRTRSDLRRSNKSAGFQDVLEPWFFSTVTWRNFHNGHNLHLTSWGFPWRLHGHKSRK